MRSMTTYVNRLNDYINNYADSFEDIRKLRDWMVVACEESATREPMLTRDGKPILRPCDVELELRELIAMAGFYRAANYRDWTTSDLLYSFCDENAAGMWGTVQSANPVGCSIPDEYLIDEDKWANRMPRAAAFLSTRVPDSPKFGRVEWCDEDLRNALELADIPATDVNVGRLRRELNLNGFRVLEEHMIEAGWEVIYTVRDDLLNDKQFREADGSAVSPD